MEPFTLWIKMNKRTLEHEFLNDHSAEFLEFASDRYEDVKKQEDSQSSRTHT